MRVELTQEWISKGLICSEGRRKIEYTDSGPGGVPGLFVEVRAGSPEKATFWLRYKNPQSQTCYQRLGCIADLTLAAARKTARELRARIVLGADPRAEAKARKAVLTYGEFFEQHYLRHVRQSKRSWDRDEELYRLRIKAAFGGKRLNQITRHQIQSFLTELAEEGLAAATVRLHLVLLRFSLNCAREWGMLEGDNPASRIPMPYVDNRIERYLDEAELQRLLHVLRTDQNRTVCAIALFLLSTGCRLNEALSARWSDIDTERRVLTIRANNSKSKRVRAVPLNDAALDVLSSLDTRGEFEHVFVNRATKRPYTTIAKVWDRLRRKAGIAHLRLHDLRHGFASFLINDGRTLYEVQAILGHSSSKVTERYAHLSAKTLQEAANSASEKIRTA